MRGGRLIVCREPGRAGLPRVDLGPGQSLVWDHRFELSASDDAMSAEARALGPEGRRVLAHALPSHHSARRSLRLLPRQAVEALPGLWARGRLMAVPWLETLGLQTLRLETPRSQPDSTEHDGVGWPSGQGYSSRFVGFDRR